MDRGAWWPTGHGVAESLTQGQGPDAEKREKRVNFVQHFCYLHKDEINT